MLLEFLLEGENLEKKMKRSDGRWEEEGNRNWIKKIEGLFEPIKVNSWGDKIGLSSKIIIDPPYK
jgi:hypothetical protein